jgi:PAS domain S-box-containing protein
VSANSSPALPAGLGGRLLTDALVDAAPDAILVVDTAGTIVFANLAAQQLFGYSRAELVDSPIELLVTNDTRPSTSCTALITSPRRDRGRWVQGLS